MITLCPRHRVRYTNPLTEENQRLRKENARLTQ